MSRSIKVGDTVVLGGWAKAVASPSDGGADWTVDDVKGTMVKISRTVTEWIELGDVRRKS